MSSEDEDAATSSEGDGAGDTPTDDIDRRGYNRNVNPLAGQVASSSPLKLFERETSILFSGDDDEARVESRQLSVTRRLLNYPHFDPDTLHILVDGNIKNIDPDEYDGEEIIGVRGNTPIGALKLGSDVRTSGGYADVVSDGRGFSGKDSNSSGGDGN